MKPKLNITDQRMLQVFDLLIDSGTERFKRHICQKIDVIEQNLRNIRLGNQHFTAENIRLMCETYGVNPAYIMGLEDKVYTKKGVSKSVNKGIDINRLSA